MFERYTETGRRAIFAARIEASRFGSSKIETEHLLLGLVREDAVLVNRFLISEISDTYIRTQILALTPTHEIIPASEDIPLSDESKSTLAFAAEEADALGQQHIGTEHLLLGLLHRQDCFAARMLIECGAEIEIIRKELATTHQLVSPESRKSRITKEIVRLALEDVQLAEEFHKEKLTTSHSVFPNPDEFIRAASRFKDYTEKARRSIFFAWYEASQLGSPLIETEHLLLGVLRESKAFLDLFLPSTDSITTIRKQIEEHSAVREKPLPGERLPARINFPLSDECERVLTYAEEEAANLGRERVGPEHLLLGLLREEGNFAARLLHEHGAEIGRIRHGLAASSKQPPPNPADPSQPSEPAA